MRRYCCIQFTARSEYCCLRAGEMREEGSPDSSPERMTHSPSTVTSSNFAASAIPFLSPHFASKVPPLCIYLRLSIIPDMQRCFRLGKAPIVIRFCTQFLYQVSQNYPPRYSCVYADL